MNKKTLLNLVVLLLIVAGFSSCSEDEKIPVLSTGTINVEMPLGIEKIMFSNAKAVLTNVQTKEQITAENFVNTNGTFSSAITNVPEGTYNIVLTGDLTFTKGGIAGSSKVNVSRENVKIDQNSKNITLSINDFKAEGGFVISEIFFTGTQTPEGKQYSDDQYIVISNNSDVTLYADSIAIVESAFMTIDKQNYTPDIMTDTMSVEALYMIPGKGTDVPVEPGKSLIIALNGKDHLKANPNSIDLSKADFEFYDESPNPNFLDEDNQGVPNLDKWYCYTKSWFGLHNRGFHAYAIAKMKSDKQNYLDKYFYKASYTFVFGDFSTEMTTDAYKVPNSWILDAVNLSIESKYEWQVTSSALDKGWAHCGKVDHDMNRYGKAVVRKFEKGKWIDTNNSTDDFESDAKPSLLKEK